MKHIVQFELDAGIYLAQVDACNDREFNQLFRDLLRRRFGQFEAPNLFGEVWESVPENMTMHKLQRCDESAFLITVAS